MTSEQYTKALAKLNLTATTGAYVIGVTPRQSFRYAAGATPVPLVVERLLWFMSHCGVPEQWRP